MSSCRLRTDESGVAIVTALLAVVILSGLALVFMNRANTETRASAHSRDHEAAIHAGEAAADKQIARLNADDLHITEGVDGQPVEADPTDLVDEEGWLLGLLPDDLGDVVGWDAWVETSQGQSFAVRPYFGTMELADGTVVDAPIDVIYSVGAVPSFDAPNRKLRVIKLQVDQDRFVPEFALLTEAPLKFGGNASIVVPGCDSSTVESAIATCTADVHTNGTFTNSGSSSTIQGYVTQASGTCPSSVTALNGCLDGDDDVEPHMVPAFQARDFYNRTDGLSAEWYDLCPPGKPVTEASVREPSGNQPCSAGSTQLWPAVGLPSSDFRGWKWQAGQWRGGSIQSGVYYVYHADAKVTGSDGQVQATIIAERDMTSASTRANSGSIDLSGNPAMEAAMNSVLMVADADLDMQGTPSGGSCGITPGRLSGFIGVGEQLKTQGTVELRGAIIVRNDGTDHGLVTNTNDGVGGTMCLEFDPTLAVDFTGIWVITYWNEL